MIALAIVSMPKESCARPLVTPEQMSLAQEILTPEQLAAALKAQELALSIGRIKTGIEMEMPHSLMSTRILPYLDLSVWDEEIFRQGYNSRDFGPTISEEYFLAGSSFMALPQDVRDLLTEGVEERLGEASSQEEKRALIRAITQKNWLSLDPITRMSVISFSGLAPILKAKAVLLAPYMGNTPWKLPKELAFLKKFKFIRDEVLLELQHRRPRTDLFQVILDTRQLARHLGVQELLDRPELTSRSPVTLHQHISTLDLDSPWDLAELINQYMALKIFAAQAPEPFLQGPDSIRTGGRTLFNRDVRAKGVLREEPYFDHYRREFRRLAFPFEQQQVWIFGTYADFKRDPKGTVRRLQTEIQSMLDKKTIQALVDLDAKEALISFSIDKTVQERLRAVGCTEILIPEI